LRWLTGYLPRGQAHFIYGTTRLVTRARQFK